MAEILVKTYTRHRDQSSPYYMKDWTAGDVVKIAPDGYYTGNSHAGAKQMGIVLKLPGIQLPSNYVGKAENVLSPASKTSAYINKRSNLIVNLASILTVQQLKDAYDHSVWKQPITITKSYLDLFQARELRTSLSPYDKQGSFDNQTVDVGPGGHADANDFEEFESNIAASLTGPVIGDCDEDFDEATALLTFAGVTTSAANYIECRTSGAGKHAGKVGAANYRLQKSGTGDYTIYLNNSYVRFTDFYVDGVNTAQYDNNGCISIGQYVVRARFIRSILCNWQGRKAITYDYNGGDTKLIAVNCKCIPSAWGNAGSAIDVATNDTTYLYNLTLITVNSDGINGSATTVCKNCLVQSGSGTAYTGSFHGDSDYNLSDDASNTGGDNDVVSTAVTFNVDGSYDLDTTDTGAKDQGVDLSEDLVFGFSDDIHEDIRSGTWDIGADEYVATGGAVYSPPDIHSIAATSGNKNGMGNIDNISTWNRKKFEFKENEKWQEQYSRRSRRRKRHSRRQAKNALFV